MSANRPRGRVEPEPEQPKKKIVFGDHIVCPWCKGKGRKGQRQNICGACEGTGIINE